MTHPDGIGVSDAVARTLPNRREHDPRDLVGAFALAQDRDAIPIGLFYRNADAVRYDVATARGWDSSGPDRLKAIQAEIDRFLV
jgi:hypothetical protein